MKILTTNDSNMKDVCKDVRVFAFFTTAHLAYRLVSTLASIEKTSDQKNTYRTLSSITVFLSLPLTVNDTEHQAGTNETPTQHQEDHFLITLTEAPSGPDELALSSSWNLSKLFSRQRRSASLLPFERKLSSALVRLRETARHTRASRALTRVSFNASTRSRSLMIRAVPGSCGRTNAILTCQEVSLAGGSEERGLHLNDARFTDVSECQTVLQSPLDETLRSSALSDFRELEWRSGNARRDFQTHH